MIRDWKVSTPKYSPSGPLGCPFMANRTYMRVFIVLERMAFMRLTDEELDYWAKQNSYSVSIDALAEQRRRLRLVGVEE